MKKQAETYATINIADLPLIDFSQIKESSQYTIRRRLDGNAFIIKYNTEPSFIIDQSVLPLEIMNYTEALALMQTDEWDARIDEGFVNKPAQIKL
jgi:hypothetical protein